MPEATRSAVMMGPLSLIIEKMMMPGSIDFAPNRARLTRVCMLSTTPTAAPANATRGSDLAPIDSIFGKPTREIRKGA